MRKLDYFNGQWGFTPDGELVTLEEDIPVWVAVNDPNLADYSGGDYV